MSTKAQADAERAIKRAGQKRARGEKLKEEGTKELAKAIRKGTDVGLTTRRMQTLAGLSREGFYIIKRRTKAAKKARRRSTT